LLDFGSKITGPAIAGGTAGRNKGSLQGQLKLWT